MDDFLRDRVHNRYEILPEEISVLFIGLAAKAGVTIGCAYRLSCSE